MTQSRRRGKALRRGCWLPAGRMPLWGRVWLEVSLEVTRPGGASGGTRREGVCVDFQREWGRAHTQVRPFALL